MKLLPLPREKRRLLEPLGRAALTCLLIPSAGRQGLFLFQTKVHKILYAFQKLPDQLFCRRVLVLPWVDDKTDFTFGGLLDERNPTDGTAL